MVVADVPNWAFGKICKAIKKYCKDWDVHFYYMNWDRKQKYDLSHHKKFDLIFYLCDWYPERLESYRVPKEKIILAVRSDVNNLFYTSNKLRECASALAVANKNLYERFKHLHPEVKVCPGGVDVRLFRPKDAFSHNEPLVVGWAGSKENPSLRGLSFIEKACNKVGYIYNPAYREDKWRTEEEMVKYYQDEIDIYVDMSNSAGRQNGLIEAGSCGIPLISTRVGIAAQLIKDGVNGYLVDRDVDSLSNALLQIRSNLEKFRKGMRRTILQSWSWESQIKLFQDLFNKFYMARS